jgi:phosphoribosylformylglycinamidine synthase
MPILTIPGAEALSSFRRERLNRRLTAHGARLGAVRELFVICGADPVEESRLAEVLQWGTVAAAPAGTAASRHVAPRTGTRSPWSSKATEILRRCGLAAERVAGPGPVRRRDRLPAARYAELGRAPATPS